MKIEWIGDLDDDCTAKLGNYSAHCEVMHTSKVGPTNSDLADGDDEEPYEASFWFAAVYADSQDGEGGVSNVVFHSGEYAGAFSHGELARAVCETIMQIAHDRDQRETIGMSETDANKMASDFWSYFIDRSLEKDTAIKTMTSVFMNATRKSREVPK